MKRSRAVGIKVHWVNRGGGCVLHLPGQLAAYFALPLDRCGLSLQDYLDRLHSTIMLVLEEFDLAGSRPRGLTRRVFGAGTNRHGRRGRQPLDCLPWADAQRRAVPRAVSTCWTNRGSATCHCGYTSMEARRQRHTAMSKVREALIRNLEQVFGLERHHVYTHHPLIRRKVFSHVYAPSPG